MSSVLAFTLTFNGFCFDELTSGYCQLSVLSSNSIKLMDIDATKYLLLLGCQDVTHYSQSVYHLFPHYHPVLAGESRYLLKDATITNCLKWILFILGGFNLFASLLCLSGISQFYLSSSRIQTCLLVCGILELNFYRLVNHYWNNYARTRPLFSSPTQTWRSQDQGSIFLLELSH